VTAKTFEPIEVEHLPAIKDEAVGSLDLRYVIDGKAHGLIHRNRKIEQQKSQKTEAEEWQRDHNHNPGILRIVPWWQPETSTDLFSHHTTSPKGGTNTLPLGAVSRVITNQEELAIICHVFSQCR
jgi:hypothetical protein